MRLLNVQRTSWDPRFTPGNLRNRRISPDKRDRKAAVRRPSLRWTAQPLSRHSSFPRGRRWGCRVWAVSRRSDERPARMPTEGGGGSAFISAHRREVRGAKSTTAISNAFAPIQPPRRQDYSSRWRAAVIAVTASTREPVVASGAIDIRVAWRRLLEAIESRAP